MKNKEINISYVGFFNDDFANNCMSVKIIYPTGGLLYTLEKPKYVKQSGLFVRLLLFKAMRYFKSL